MEEARPLGLQDQFAVEVAADISSGVSSSCHRIPIGQAFFASPSARHSGPKEPLIWRSSYFGVGLRQVP
jgi:hypothetical protein